MLKEGKRERERKFLVVRNFYLKKCRGKISKSTFLDFGLLHYVATLAIGGI